MSGGGVAFFGFVASCIVFRGKNGAWEENVRGVHGVSFMLMQICRDYQQLPPVLELDLHDIRFWYDGLRAELMEVRGSGG